MASSLFGGVQVFTIIFTIIRTKAAALLLGPAGMGIVGLFTASIDFIGAATNFGLATSAVRSLAQVSSEGDETKLGETVTVVKNLAMATGLGGMLVMMGFSVSISELVFGNAAYRWAFVILGVTLLLNQLLASRQALIQGFRKLNLLALCTIINAVASLLVTVPLYYFFGTDGIVPALVLISAANLLAGIYFSSHLGYARVPVALWESFRRGGDILRLGFFIGFSGLLGLGSAYILRLFINEFGSLEEVGLYSAGFAIINTYVGLVFTAMATDYFPRLSLASADPKLFSEEVSHQMEVALLLLGPILCWFVVLVEPLVSLLYSSDFVGIVDMLVWSALGMLFKAVGWCLGYVVLAKGSSGFFFRNELIALVYQLGLNLAGYYFLGLDGLGIAFLVGYFLYVLQVIGVCRWRFPVLTAQKVPRLFFVFLMAVSLCAFAFFVSDSKWIRYSLGLPLSILASVYSFRELDRALDLTAKIKKKISKT